MDTEQRDQLIVKYRAGYEAVIEALRGMREDELDRSASGEWTPRQIAHHLADSEMMSAIRLRLLVAEDEPLLSAYDEMAFASSLTRDRPIEPSIEAMRWARESSAQILDRLTEQEWTRTGTHAESGAYSVESWLEIYAGHPHDHAAQIKRSRGLA
jgi:DinB family protein